MKESTHKQNCRHLHPILGLPSCLENHSGWPAIPVGTSRTMGSMDIIISVLLAVFRKIKYTTVGEIISFK